MSRQPDTSEFTEPRFHSLARAPHDSQPTIEIAHEGAPCLFAIDFGAGSNSVERMVMRAEATGVRQVPTVIRKNELLFARVMVPVGHTVKILVRWLKP